MAAVSIPVLLVVCSLHLLAFVFAVGAERRRSTGKVVPDEYDELSYCQYNSDASTIYGISAFVAVLVSQTLIQVVTRCLCFGRGLTIGPSKACAVCFFVFSWVTFLGAEACLVAGSVRNAYHTKYRERFGVHQLSCAALRKGVFAAAAALLLLSLASSLLFYWTHSRADTGGWEKHRDEGLPMNAYPPQAHEFGSDKA